MLPAGFNRFSAEIDLVVYVYVYAFKTHLFVVCCFFSSPKKIQKTNESLLCKSRRRKNVTLAASRPFEYRFFINFNYIFNFSHPKLDVISKLNAHKFRSEWHYFSTYLVVERFGCVCVCARESASIASLLEWAKRALVLQLHVSFFWQKKKNTGWQFH